MFEFGVAAELDERSNERIGADACVSWAAREELISLAARLEVEMGLVGAHVLAIDTPPAAQFDR